jgi:hypothetical protein
MRLLPLILLAACGDSTNVVVDARLADASADASALSAFLPAVTLPAGQNPTSVALVDLDADGELDLVVANTNGTTVSVFLNTTGAAATTPSFAASLDFTVGMNPAWVTFGDLNNDAKTDLAVANVGDSTVSVLLNTTTGTGTPQFAITSFTTGSNPECVAIGDLDGNGRQDLALANVVAGTVSVLLNTTTTGALVPTFAAKVDFPTGGGALAVDMRDLDADGTLDLVVANLNANTTSVLLGTTAMGALVPTFAAKIDLTTPMPRSLAIADLDGDGKPDLAVARGDADFVSVFVDTTTTPGLVTFAPRVDVPSGGGPDFVALGRIDGDDAIDLAVANSTGNSVSVIHNTTAAGASPTFAAKADDPTGVNPRAVAIGDLNRDGKADLVVANGTSNTISILLAR